MDASLAGDAALLAGAALLAVGAVLSLFAERFRAPALLLFLAVGMIVGSDGLGWIDFGDPELAQRIGVVALVVILFEGGLRISVDEARGVIAPAAVLATVGVVVTAAVVAVVVVVSTDHSITTAALLGAVVASTDAAAVFAVLRRAPVPRRLAAMLEVESGGNDPVAVLLTIGILASWQSDPTAADWVLFGLRQVLGGLAVGVAVGWCSAWVLRRAAAIITTDVSAFRPVLALASAGLAYGVGAAFGASGFLAVFITGIIVGAGEDHGRVTILHFHEGLATVAQIALFLMLGLLAFPYQVFDVIGIGFLVAAVLIFVARPLATLVCSPVLGVGPREGAFIAWSGLRGAVPIVLATLPLTAGYPQGVLVFDVVFFVVLISAVVQGFTIAPVARRLGLSGPEGEAKAAHIQ